MTADKKLWRNRKKGRNGSDDCDQRIQLRGGLSACSKVEVGNRAHCVAARPDRDPEPVRRSECFTADLHRTRVTGLMRKSGPICYARDFGASRTRRMSLAIFLI